MQSFTTTDGARLAYRDEGDGFPVLALAGLTRDSRDFDYLSAHLPPGVRLIRLDSRGRGSSDWTGAATYTVPHEASDALALLDHLSIPRAAVIGTSRGGLLGMMIALTHKDRLAGLCLNDVGPVLDMAGLRRISAYVGVAPTVRTLEEVAERMAAAMPGFAHVPDFRWQEETVRHYVQHDGAVGLTYDPALKQAFDSALAVPAVDLWPLFDACAGLPLALIRGQNSDLLARDTADEMRRRRPDMEYAEVADRGHIPFLDEPEAVACIARWLARLMPR